MRRKRFARALGALALTIPGLSAVAETAASSEKIVAGLFTLDPALVAKLKELLLQ